MNDKKYITEKLTEFIATDKFKTYQHLQPAVANSTPEDIAFVNNEMNACCREILAKLQLADTDDAVIKAVINQSTEKIKDAMLDTEDVEFCFELYFVISDIAGVPFRDEEVDPGQLFMQQMERIAKIGGIDLSQFLKPKPPGEQG